MYMYMACTCTMHMYIGTSNCFLFPLIQYFVRALASDESVDIMHYMYIIVWMVKYDNNYLSVSESVTDAGLIVDHNRQVSFSSLQ